jgi:adenylate cyclase
MAKEVERKFLVVGEGWRGLSEAALPVRQFYLAAIPGRSVRVRVTGDHYATLTLKFGSHGRERDEFEYPVPLEDADELLAFAVGCVIEKTRHHVRYRGYLYEVDVFAGALAGLVMAELETADHIPDVSLPAWLGREVTGEGAYYNASLARYGLPAAA